MIQVLFSFRKEFPLFLILNHWDELFLSELEEFLICYLQKVSV